MQNNNIITLAGRDFRPIKHSTINHENWMMVRIRAAGLVSMKLADGEDTEAFIRRLASSVWESGKAVEIMSGLLIPAEIEDVKWTPEMAPRMADFIGNLFEDDDKAKVRQAIGEFLYLFFIIALYSSKTFPKFSEEAEAEKVGERSGSGASSDSTIGAT